MERCSNSSSVYQAVSWLSGHGCQSLCTRCETGIIAHMSRVKVVSLYRRCPERLVVSITVTNSSIVTSSMNTDCCMDISIHGCLVGCWFDNFAAVIWFYRDWTTTVNWTASFMTTCMLFALAFGFWKRDIRMVYMWSLFCKCYFFCKIFHFLNNFNFCGVKQFVSARSFAKWFSNFGLMGTGSP